MNFLKVFFKGRKDQIIKNINSIYMEKLIKKVLTSKTGRDVPSLSTFVAAVAVAGRSWTAE